MFKALVLSKNDDGVSSEIQEMNADQLPEGDVVVNVEYSTLNYKDGLVLNGLGGLVRNYPHVGGVDFAGTVETSTHADFKAGDKVVLTGWRVGEVHWGGYGQKARVSGDWLVHLPEGLDTRQAMAVGTAGFTSMLGVMALEDQGLSPEKGEVLITGAAGGVGSVAAAILAKLGYDVAGSTGRADTHDYLREMGVKNIIGRDELSEASKRPLEKELWAGCIDAVGGTTLSRVLAQMKYGGSVAAIGLAGGNKLDATVIPFLLRGVNLLGIDSVMCPKERRVKAWNRIVTDLPMEKLDGMISQAKLQDLPQLGKDIIAGQVRGRVVVDVAGS
ncbi:putative oxidoreductase, Zn-dependent and NAD(P)-binding [Candidatus Terasakiella magnetica]|uniref:Putative oxidoreductase, Zn-dependent and NAD(P)-binding n=1 Tax=Candidatus Terasakiella magnetica TaxID=1867952 RepID=A0A1C3REC0_9PROT|nr:MDR family oxidoreductase [Candidatus Terasakiella magnetica]SCA55633.1 putative oxidoreductase, Zn-dependent and NAD(P)-binding [Candidatus Terasakiella magnetica]